MPLSSGAEQQLRNALRDFRAAHSGAVVPGNDGKALEAWVMMRLAHVVWRFMPTWRVTLRRGDGTALPAGAPFDLASHRSRIQASSASAPGYVLFEHRTFPDRRFELRGSVQWKGRSDANHEIDVSMVPAVIGEALRNNGGGYPRGLPIVAVECKDKGGVGTLDETRETLARMYDLVLVTQPVPSLPCRVYESVTHQRWGRKSSRYISFFRKGTFAIVRAGTFQSGAATLARHYSIRHVSTAYTTGLGALEQQFRDTLATVSSF